MVIKLPSLDRKRLGNLRKQAFLKSSGTAANAMLMREIFGRKAVSTHSVCQGTMSEPLSREVPTFGYEGQITD